MRRFLLGLLVVLLVLGGAFVAGDQWARQRAEQRTATLLGEEIGTVPQVEAHGWPFLLALARGSVEQLDVTAPSATLVVDDHAVEVSDLDVTAEGVGPLSDPQRTAARTLQGTMRVDYQQMSQALGATMNSAGGDRVRLAQRTPVFGQEMDVVVEAKASVSGGKLALSDPEVTMDGEQLDDAQAEALVGLVESGTTLPTVAGLQLDQLTASPEGLLLRVSGQDVVLDELR